MMKRSISRLVFLVALLAAGSAPADSPIFTGLLWDSAPAVAYNSRDGEFLVVWNVFNILYPNTDERFFGPVMGQLVKDTGEKIGQPFEIVSTGVLPDVAYNAEKNEYLVVAEQWFNTVGQRVSAVGLTIGGPTVLLMDARYPRVLYNALSGDYLVTGAWLSLSSPPPDNCRISIHTVPVGPAGQPAGPVTTPVYQNYGIGTCEEEAVYAIAHAPVTSSAYLLGKYLLAVKDARDLTILDGDGTYSTAASGYDDGTQIEKPFNVDIAFGYLEGDPVFFLVWGETDSPFTGSDGLPWNGIWSGFIDAQNHTKVANGVFPVSLIWSHWADASRARQWRPKTAYNPAADTFVVVWRETPAPHANNITDENHIRINTRNSLASSAGANVVVSATSGLEDPTLPAIASGTATNKTLVAWEDHRGFFGIGDTYGSFVSAATKTPSDIQPPAPDSGRSFWESVSAGGSHSLGLHQAGGPSCCDLWAWGFNSSGQLGLGHNTSQNTPRPVGAGTDWRNVVAGDIHTLGIRSDGSLWAWGNNSYGELGLGNETDQNSPRQVGSHTDWVSIAAGHRFSLGIRANGTLWAWGRNYEGQLGLGHETDQNSPQQVGSHTDWVSVSAGYEFSLGIRSDGSLWAWGFNPNIS